jgi:acetyl-CoA carboxylase biotin carboxyl carrier protein
MKKRDNKTKASGAGLKVVGDAPSGGNGDAEGNGIDFESVRVLARIAAEFDLAEVVVDRTGLIRIRRAGFEAAPGPAVAPSGGRPPIGLSAAPPVDGPAEGAGTFISSPFVGTFYRSPSPEAPTFVEVGHSVRKGQVVCIVEAMKLMNEIEAEAEGKIVEILVKNGEHVEYGQHLFRLAKA